MTADTSNALGRLVERLSQEGVRYCVVGGLAVDAYVEPVVSLDLDLAVAADDIERLVPALAGEFTIERFPHSLELSSPGSDVRVQFQTDSRHAPFARRAEQRNVLGVDLPVARIEDVLQGKILESFPELRHLVPREVFDRLV